MSPRRPNLARTSLALTAATISLAAGLAVPDSATAAPSRPFAGRAPAIRAQTIEGRTFRLSSLRGKVVVLDFLTPDCGECQLEAPILEQAAATYRRRGVRFVIVDLSNAAPALLRSYYRTQLALASITVVRDHNARIARAYGVFDLGSTFVLDRAGRIAWHGLWQASKAALTAAIARAL
jgi:thiol-disulfide isomerase/thioredoxin